MTTMNFNLTVIGLSLDIIGFMIIFFIGGFELGSAGILQESDKSHKTKLFKIIGAILIILGFVLQLCGSLEQPNKVKTEYNQSIHPTAKDGG